MSVRWCRSGRTAWPAATAWHGLLGGPTVLTARPCGERNRRGLWRTMVLARPLEVVRAATELPGRRTTAERLPPGVRAAERRCERAFLRFEVGPNTAFWGLSAPCGALGSQTHSSHGDRRAPPALWLPRRRVSSLHARGRARHEAPSCRRGRDAANNRTGRPTPPPSAPRVCWAGGTAAVTPIPRPRRYRLATVTTTNSIVHYHLFTIGPGGQAASRPTPARLPKSAPPAGRGAR